MSKLRQILAMAVVGLVTSLADAESLVDGREFDNQKQGANWFSYGRTYLEQFYSPLSDINRSTVKQLGLAWFLDLPGERTLEAVPLAVNGVLTFALGKHTPLPPGGPPRLHVNAVDAPELVIDPKEAARGAQQFSSTGCGLCHGPQMKNVGSFAPDLRESALAMNWEAFKSVVHEGSLAAAGMPRFSDLTDENMRAIYMYIRQRARESAHPPH